MPETPQIGPDAVLKVAKLSRLEVGEGEAPAIAAKLGAVLKYMEGLKSVDVEGVRPMTHPDDEVNRLAEDEPSGVLERDAFLAMAPETMGPFVRVPKVIDGGGSA
ncbi:MAG: Asp-tRNA(Asn)/Glu-tRNA(Gln) amidotransferase GatCAB subunit C [Phycisphaerales bacterium]|nr:MAG: Asp-tRNA(Asn)/Glu-tRNA(Gln) amidotransferase GatCAB subunit C [Phycisphaerales bacterium]